VSRTTVFGLFSGALLLSAVLGPAVGRGVLALSNLVLATGLVLLVARGFTTLALALAWAVLGIGMAMGLYDPAFATLTARRLPPVPNAKCFYLSCGCYRKRVRR
jgi:hypothetical protein